jgi:choline dehydrogenase-like flavoprotein
MAKDHLDAIVVGSGATGGWAAKKLTEGGLRVALVEAGPMLFGSEAEKPAPVAPSRQPVQERCSAFDEDKSPLFVDDVDNPYSHPPDEQFDWIRSRQVGGRLLLWDRICLRMSDHELKAASYDGVGEDWPISYEDLRPHYDQVERFLEIAGTASGFANVPDGQFVAPPPPSAGERQFRRVVEERWPERAVTDARTALAPPEACLNAALQTGRLSLRADSVVSRVTLTPQGDRAKGVAYVDRQSGREGEIAADAVFLCASTIESTRLLLNSATDGHPDGLGNSSGVLGRYLMDHIFSIGLDGFAAPSADRGTDPSSNGCFIPSFRNVGRSEGLGFVRGYGIGLQIYPREARLKMWLKNRGRAYGGWFWMRAFGEVLPNDENKVTLDPDRVDAWGIPIAHVECRYGENERLMAADQLERVQEIAEATGLQPRYVHSELSPPGLSIHEVGAARMGADPETSVLDRFNRSWEIENLLVTDGSCFVSSGFQNPTLTMMAITDRACEHYLRRQAGREP